MKLLRAIGATLGVVAGLMVAPAEASAAVPWNGVKTYVIESLPSDWPVLNSVNWVDGYTGSDMVLASACPAGAARCIWIRNGRLSTSGTGWASWNSGFSRVTITIDVQKTKTGKFKGKFGYYTKRYLIDHELGHANGVRGHNRSCTSRMYENIRCPWGGVPPRTFTSAEQRLLRTR